MKEKNSTVSLPEITNKNNYPEEIIDACNININIININIRRYYFIKWHQTRDPNYLIKFLNKDKNESLIYVYE